MSSIYYSVFALTPRVSIDRHRRQSALLGIIIFLVIPRIQQAAFKIRQVGLQTADFSIH